MYEKAEKEIGNKYYHLTIIGINYEETEKHNYGNNGEHHGVYFDFECDCENKTKMTRRFNTVKTGHTMSCGCSKFNNPKVIEDLTGKKFGRLTVVERDFERDKNSKTKCNAHWLCKCDCGNPILSSVTGYQLKTGHTQSCGCYASEQISKRNKKYSTKINDTVEKDDCIIILDDDKNQCVIDKEDYNIVKNWYWRKIDKRGNIDKGYWVTNSKIDDKYDKSIIMIHQIIAEIKFGEYDKNKVVPDHLSRDTDDNRKCNIYLKSNPNNSHNRGISKANTSGKTGVSFRKDNNMWQAYITVNYKTKHLGFFSNIDDAIKARKEAEIKYKFTCDEVVDSYDYNDESEK